MPRSARSIVLALGLALYLTIAASAVAQQPGSAPPTALTDGVWQLQRILFMDDSELVPDDPARYTVRFGGDGSLQVRADCNRGAGRYEVDGVGLTIPPFALTRALCPPDSIDHEYVRELLVVVSFVLEDDVLALATAIDTSILVFERAPEK